MSDDNELRNALNRGKGLALICALIECPHCNQDIWVNIGQHCGMDAVLDGCVNCDCYKCCHPIKLVLDFITQKEYSFMTIEEHTKLEVDGFNENYKKDEK